MYASSKPRSSSRSPEPVRRPPWCDLSKHDASSAVRKTRPTKSPAATEESRARHSHWKRLCTSVWPNRLKILATQTDFALTDSVVRVSRPQPGSRLCGPFALGQAISVLACDPSIIDTRGSAAKPRVSPGPCAADAPSCRHRARDRPSQGRSIGCVADLCILHKIHLCRSPLQIAQIPPCPSKASSEPPSTRSARTPCGRGAGSLVSVA